MRATLTRQPKASVPAPGGQHTSSRVLPPPFFHGGGVGMGYSQHSGMVIVADGTDAAAARLANVLVNDCGSGVMRHADAGYELAVETAKKQGLKLPMVPGAR